MTKEIAYNKIQELVTRFSEQIISYKKSEYNETLTRRDFIDPFFKALGWDVDNEQGNAEAYREVIHEDKIKIGSATKAPDYSFRLSGGKRLFFVEAKKPSVFIKDEILPAYQVRRYGWSAKLAISIITDFEEFAIYDCSKKPLPTDKAAVARIKYLNYKDYLTEFDFIWDTFSKEKVLKGSFDKFIQGTANKKGTTTVDKEFLQTLDNCRTILAESIAKLNPALDEDEINFAVQQTIDRIIFLRIAEDRSIEPYGKLQEAVTPLSFRRGAGGEVQSNYYTNLFGIFKIADDKYNSGLFNFKKDTISQNLQIDNKVLKTIINQFYYPECPYEFSVLSVEILGSAYEQFLGKVIKIIPPLGGRKGAAVIELKPEVRKAGGVYYTPQYIVDYIVENTVGKLVGSPSPLGRARVGLTPKQIAELKIVDPACGSGSFLIGAYQYLLNWHSTYYQQNPAQAKKDKALTPTGSLSTSIKKQILLNNIYGVDIDVNAVEVTKLSLLLKCMEGETQSSIANQASLFNERVLPTLDDNIKSGNSLIDTDYYDTQLDFGEEKKIKPFNWQKAFPDVFKNGGFDCVIGNPPYVSIKEIATNQKKYFINKYLVATGQFDLYTLFIEKSFSLLKDDGFMGMITSNTYINNKDAKKLREIILKDKHINQIINLGETVFIDANLDVSILILKNKTETKLNSKIIINDTNFKKNISHNIHQTIWLETNNDFVFNINISTSDLSLINKLFNNKSALSKFLDLPRGIEIGGNSELITKKYSINLLPIIYGRNINKYQIEFDNNYIEFDQKNKSVFKDISIYNQEKILIQRIRNLSLKQRIVATLDVENYVCTNTLRIGILKEKKISIKYLLGILNSNTINWIFLKKFLNKDIYAYQLEQIPIVDIVFTNKNEKHFHDQIVNFVEQLLQLNKDLQATTLETKKEQLKNKIDYCEDKINQLVYQLYNLTDDEIKIVEGN